VLVSGSLEVQFIIVLDFVSCGGVLSDIIRVMKSRRVRWAGRVVCVEERGSAYRILVGKPGGKRQLGELGVDGMMILSWILRKWVVLHRLG